MPLQLPGEHRPPRAHNPRGEIEGLWCAGLLLLALMTVSGVAGYIVGLWLGRCP